MSLLFSCPETRSPGSFNLCLNNLELFTLFLFPEINVYNPSLSPPVETWQAEVSLLPLPETNFQHPGQGSVPSLGVSGTC